MASAAPASVTPRPTPVRRLWTQRPRASPDTAALRAPGLDERRLARLATLEAHLDTALLGQGPAIQEWTRHLRRAWLGLSDPQRPRLRLMLLGPTGTGKTQLVRTTHQWVFGREDAIARFDMAEHSTSADAHRFLQHLARAAASLQGEFGRCLLFDEIEKAAPEVRMVLLGMLDAGRVTPPSGDVLDLSGFSVVVTSNLGASAAMEMQDVPYETLANTMRQCAMEELKPETFARFSAVIVFSHLPFPTLCAIVEKELAAQLHRMGALANTVVTPGAEVVRWFARRCEDQRLGARPVRDLVETVLGDLFAHLLLSKSPNASDAVARHSLQVSTLSRSQLALVPA